MNTKISLGAIVILIVMQVNLSCKKEKSCEDCNENNKPPIAIAGPDQVITLPTDSISLDGTASNDPDGTISKWLWTMISGPASFNVINPKTSGTVVKNLVVGIYQFELKVTDDKGLVSKDSLTVTVDPTWRHWTRREFLPPDHFFFGTNMWRPNILMGIDDKIFAISFKGSVWQFNDQINGWSEVGSFPEGAQPWRPEFYVFSVMGKGYCITNDHCWQFDPVTYIWARKNDPPVGAPLVISDKVYFVGLNEQLLVYDPIADSYNTISSIPPGMNGLPGFAIFGEGYYIASDGQGWKYKPANNTWVQIAGFYPAANTALYSWSFFSTTGFGYIIGDLNDATYNNNEPMKVWRYDPVQNAWTEFEENYPGFGAYSIQTISSNGKAYIGLGYNNGDFHAIDFWRFNE